MISISGAKTFPDWYSIGLWDLRDHLSGIFYFSFFILLFSDSCFEKQKDEMIPAGGHLEFFLEEPKECRLLLLKIMLPPNTGSKAAMVHHHLRREHHARERSSSCNYHFIILINLLLY